MADTVSFLFFSSSFWLFSALFSGGAWEWGGRGGEVGDGSIKCQCELCVMGYTYSYRYDG